MKEGIAPRGLMCQLHHRLRHSWEAPRTLRAVHLGENLLAKGESARIGRMGRPITMSRIVELPALCHSFQPSAEPH